MSTYVNNKQIYVDSKQFEWMQFENAINYLNEN